MTREQIVDAAETLARSEGLDNVTVRRLSATLSVTAPALYWHLDSKGELVDEIIDRALARAERPGPETGTWLERLVACYASLRDALAEYPGITSALMTRQPSQVSLENSLYVIQLLIDAGFDDDDAVALFNALLMMVHGHLLVIDTWHFHQRVAATDSFMHALDEIRDASTQRGVAAFTRSMHDMDDATRRTHFLRGIDELARGAAQAAGVSVPRRRA